MKLIKNKTHIYGFEDYDVVSIWHNVYKNTWDCYLPEYDTNAGNYIITKDLPVKIVITKHNYWNEISFNPTLCTDHKELLPIAKKVYTHPSCKLSRSMMAEKYKKSLNPYLSDAVVIPEPDVSDLVLTTDAIYINERAKMLVRVRVDIDDSETINKVRGFHGGDTLREHVTCNFQLGGFRGYHQPKYSIEDVLSAELMYSGEVLYIPNTCSYIMDILTHIIPTDKIVYEESVQESLGCESNQLTFDSLTSIKDMLECKDDNTVSAGLKSLSMMDWVHYPNSIKYILSLVENHGWKYNPAANSTSVKYMFNTICGISNRRYWPGKFSDDIYEEDYNLFKQLKMHYAHLSEEDFMNNSRFLEFMSCDTLGILHPNIKTR